MRLQDRCYVCRNGVFNDDRRRRGGDQAQPVAAEAILKNSWKEKSMIHF